MSDDWPTLGDAATSGESVGTASVTAPGAPLSADADVPPGARCGVHGDAEARFLCVVCGTYGCGGCAFATTDRGTTCRACAGRGLSEIVPWERRRELGWMRAFWETTRLVCTQPKRFFATPAGESGMMGPVAFAVVAHTVGGALMLLSFGLVMLVGGGVAALAGETTLGAIFGLYGGCFTVGFIPFALIAYPLQGLVQVLIAAACSHGTLFLLKAQRATFEESLRAVCFASAPYFWSFVPCLGWYGAAIWVWYCEVAGLREAHRTTTDRATMAVLAYPALAFVGLVLVYGFMLFAVFALEGGRVPASPFR
jgi:hypothetical protein